MKLLHIIADYAPGDLAFSEMISALAKHLPDDFRWHYTSVHSFDTVATGFVTAQLGLQPEELRPSGTMLYVNCAPRKDLTEARLRNEGEKLVYVLLNSGVEALVVNSGYSLSFVRDEIKELWSTHVDRGGSQFRSRDIFPPVAGKLAQRDYSFKHEQLDPLAAIVAPPESVIAYVDSFGNFKTTFRDGNDFLAKLKPGQRISVTINGVERAVTVATGSFNVSEGDIAFSAGSSGQHRRYWEIFQRGGSAWHTFEKPRVGTEIKIHI